MDDALLARVEEASLNASAPPQQRWIDGWLVRYSPGKARRARCACPLAPGRLPLDEQLRRVDALYAEAGLTPHVRITPFTSPATLDAALAARGWTRIEDTPVMVRRAPPPARPRPLPAGVRWEALGAEAYAERVGDWRGSSVVERRAHAERLRLSPTPYCGYALVEAASGAALACGQFAREGEMVGLYDVVTAPEHRGRGWAALLCERMLSISFSAGARVAYLQVGGDNAVAQRLYRRLGFTEGYRYHYRVPPGA